MKNLINRAFDFLVYLLYRGADMLVGWLSLEQCVRIGEFFGPVVSWFLPGYRKLVRENMQLALGDEYTPEQLDTLRDLHFASLGKNMMCSIRTGHLSTEDVGEILEIEGAEPVYELFRKGQGVVFALTHTGNWELYGRIRIPVESVETGTMFKRIHNPFIDGHHRKHRERYGLRTFERSSGFAEPANFVRQGGGLGVLFDQHPGSRGSLVPFFGKLVSTTTLPAILSARTGAPVVFVEMNQVSSRKWKVIWHPPIFPPSDAGKRNDFVRDLTLELNRKLEQSIRKAPEEWFWVHDRWKVSSLVTLTSSGRCSAFLPENTSAKDLEPFRVAVWSPNPLGDACMAIPAVRALKEGRPDIHVTICCRKNLEPLWQALPEVDEVVSFAKGLRPGQVGGIVRKNAESFDCAILFPNSIRSALEARASGIRWIVGYRTKGRASLLNSKITPPDLKVRQTHHYLSYLSLIGRMGADMTDPESYCRIPEPPRPIRIDEEEIRIAVCPGAEYGETKKYPVDRYVSAIEELRRRRPDLVFRITVVGSPAERPIGEELCLRISEPKENTAGKTTIGGLVDLLRDSHFAVSNDTGTMHVAAALGVPTVAIFGSTEPKWTGPLGEGHVVVRHEVDCSPCFLRECPIDHRCMLRIEPEEVATAMESMLPAARGGSIGIEEKTL